MKLVTRKNQKWKTWYLRTSKKEKGVFLDNSEFLRLVQNPATHLPDWRRTLGYDLHFRTPTRIWAQRSLDWVIREWSFLLNEKDVEVIEPADFALMIHEYAPQNELGHYAFKVLMTLSEALKTAKEE